MEKIIFLGTSNTSRGWLKADIDVIDFEGWIKLIKEWVFFYNRYSFINWTSSMLNRMSVKEFEKYILPQGLTEKQITANFSVEISKKYWLHKIRKEAKRIPKKDLIPWVCYIKDNWEEVYYLWKIKYNQFIKGREQMYGRAIKDRNYSWEWYMEKNSYAWRKGLDEIFLYHSYSQLSPKKTYSKFIWISKEKPIRLPKTFIKNYDNWSELNITFLDVE